MVHDKYACTRDTDVAHIQLPSVALAASPVEHGAAHGLAELPAYRDHPVVTEALARGVPAWQIRPLAIYVDGVQYTRRDSFDAVYVQDLTSGRRHLAWVFRLELKMRSEACRSAEGAAQRS